MRSAVCNIHRCGARRRASERAREGAEHHRGGECIYICIPNVEQRGRAVQSELFVCMYVCMHMNSVMCMLCVCVLYLAGFTAYTSVLCGAASGMHVYMHIPTHGIYHVSHLVFFCAAVAAAVCVCVCCGSERRFFCVPVCFSCVCVCEGVAWRNM